MLAAFVTALVILTGACGLRVETPLPTEPVPDAHEAIRRAAVEDAETVGTLATAAATAATDERLRTTLEQVAGFAEQHSVALGGEYESGLGDLLSPTQTTTSPGTGSPTSTDTGPDAVLSALVGAAQRTTAAANVTADQEFARLLASVGTSETISARQLATLTGSGNAGVLDGAPKVPSSTPDGLAGAALASLVVSEDSAGYAAEVRAAQTEGAVRTHELTRARAHRDRAQAWAVAAGVADTTQDPRRVAYVLPNTDAATTSQQLEDSLARSYASVVGSTTAGSRAEVTALLTDCAWAAVSWGATPVAFPGLPEQAATPAPTS